MSSSSAPSLSVESLAAAEAERCNRGARAALQASEAPRAFALLQQSLRLHPRQPAVYLGLAALLIEQRRPHEALEHLDQALALQPWFPEALYNRGNALLAQGDPAAALESYERAIVQKPSFAVAFNNRGTALVQLGRTAEALESFREAHGLQPSLLAALVGAGDALVKLERFAEALDTYRGALLLQPDSPGILSKAGAALLTLGRTEQARACYATAVQLAPENVEALNGLTFAHAELHDEEAAEHCSRRALALAPHDAEARTLAGITCILGGDDERALEHLDAALRLNPHEYNATLNKAFVKLARGEFLEGWQLYESRFALRIPGRPPRERAQTRWDYQEVPRGRTLLLWAEQGLGDTLQFCRFAVELARQEVQVVLEVPPALQRLLASLEGPVRVIAAGEDPGPCDLHAALMSAPLGCRTELSTIPNTVPYLAASAARVTRWAGSLRPVGGALRIGIAWAGNRAVERCLLHGRSLSLHCVEPLLAMPRTRWFSLQKGVVGEELLRLRKPEQLQCLSGDFDLAPHAFLDTAAVMMHLDLVISSDSAVAHLAGALGVPVWVALHETPDWRWLRGRDDSPWYPTMRLFRRRRGEGGWDDVIGRIGSALTECLNRHTPLIDRRVQRHANV